MGTELIQVEAGANEWGLAPLSVMPAKAGIQEPSIKVCHSRLSGNDMNRR